MTPTSSSPAETASIAVSQRLRDATAAEHSEAESRTFIARLLGGELTLDVYRGYLAQLAYVYEALEARQSQEGDPSFIVDPRLHRFEAAQHDLTALGVRNWRDEYPALPAARAYVQRIHAVSPVDETVRYLAHHYTRYLGDLSGGQIIATMMARHYGATQDQLTFYRFDDIEALVPYKRAYRAALDDLGLDEDETGALVDEAKHAYELNSALFDALGEGL